jgi:hypothetical protein
MSVDTIIPLIVGVIGTGLVSSYFTIRWQRRNADLARLQEYKETRYKCIILLMHAYMNFDKEIERLGKHRPDIKTYRDLEDELRSEHINSFLYASDYFIQSLQDFIATPNNLNLRNTALAIRKDLWGIKTNLELKGIAP